jgi:FkbM family methyltransferase
MKFHVYAINWNEERLLPSFLEYYKDADKIYILDNESTDSSHDIIKAAGRDIITFKTGEKLDDFSNSKIKNTSWKQSKGQADYIIIQDLDEFIHFPKFPNNLLAGLKDLKGRGITAVKAHGVQMFCTDEYFDQVRTTKQSIVSQIWTGSAKFMEGYYNKYMIFDPNAIESIIFSPGAHDVQLKGKFVPDVNTVALLHFKYIGEDYVIRRWLDIRARISGLNRSNNFGSQYWRHTEEKTVAQIRDWFKLYGESSVFRLMYPDPTMCPYTFKGRRCVLHTFGASDAISGMILKGGVWEPRVAELVHALCSKPNTLYVDAGCNIGTHLAIAKLAGATHIHAFECNPVTIQKLEATIQVNGWSDITLWKTALSDASGTLPFTMVTDNLGASYIPTTHKGWGGPRRVHEPGVPIAPYDSLGVDLSGAEHIVLKMDVEGHELQALQGMRSLLSDARLGHCILELNHACVDEARVEEIISLLESHGFTTAKLVFSVPSDTWCGGQLGSLPNFPAISKEAMLNAVRQKVIMEVLFSRQ